MLAFVRLATSGLLTVNLTALVELVAFLLMLWILARFVYPPVMAAIDARQRRIADQLAAAEKARQEVERRQAHGQGAIRQAREEAGRIIEAANRASERTQQHAQDRAREEARQIVERATGEIEQERERAVGSIRRQMAEIVSGAVTKIVGEGRDGQRSRADIEAAIEEAQKEAGVTG